MLTWIHNLLGGTSPITGYLGSAIIVLDVVNQTMAEGGLPHDLASWITFVGAFFTGLALRFAKDQNRSNAAVPLEIAKKVE